MPYKRTAARKEGHRAWYRANATKVKQRSRAWQHANPGRYRTLLLLRNYGITAEQYDAMLARQGGGCVICGRPPKKKRLAVEHDHKTKRVRGLACWRCNKYCIGINTVATARIVLAYLESEFDGRKL